MFSHQSILERLGHIMSRRYKINISFTGDQVVLTEDGLILPNGEHTRFREVLETALDRGVARLAFSKPKEYFEKGSKKLIPVLPAEATIEMVSGKRRSVPTDLGKENNQRRTTTQFLGQRFDAIRAEFALGHEFIGSAYNIKRDDSKRCVQLRGVDSTTVPDWFYLAEELDQACRGGNPLWPERTGEVREALESTLKRMDRLYRAKGPKEILAETRDVLDDIWKYFPEQPKQIPDKIKAKSKPINVPGGTGAAEKGKEGGKGEGKEGESEQTFGTGQSGEENKKREGEGDKPGQGLGGTAPMTKPLELTTGFESELTKNNKEMIKKMLQDDGEYRVQTREYDTVLDYSAEGSPRLYADILRRVHTLVAPVQRKLDRIFQVEANARWKLERERGALSPRTMIRTRTEAAYRTPFQEFNKRDLTKEIAVTLLGDVSGSMGNGRRIPTQQELFVVLGKVLFKLGIPFELLTFTTAPYGYHSSKGGGRGYWAGDWEARKEWLKNLTDRMGNSGGVEYGREGEGLKHIILKSFQNPGQNLKSITTMQADCQNADGESIMWAAQRLSQYNAKRKILIVTSDGSPAVGGSNNSIVSYTRKVCKVLVPKMGIDIVGIGIQSDDVREFYDKHIVVNNIQELPKEGANLLADLLDPNPNKRRRKRT